MSRKNIENIHSLSPMQQGILFHALRDPHPSLYLVEIAWTLRGPLDAATFARAWQEVVDRHAALRTCFAWEHLPKPVAIVRRQVRLPFEEHDLGALAPEDQRAVVRRIEEEFAGRGFDPTRAPLLRLALIHLDADTHRFLWASHHLVIDGWSLPIVVREAFALYEARASGKEARLDHPRPYSDYIAWLSKRDLGETEAFWRRGAAAASRRRRRWSSIAPIAPRRHGEEGFGERTLLLPEPEGGGAPGLRPTPPAHDEHPRARRLGALPRALRRRGRGALRRDGLGPIRARPRHRSDGGPLHQHPPCAREGAARRGRAPLAPPPPGAAGGAARSRAQPPRRRARLERLAARRAALREPRRVRELPVRRGAPQAGGGPRVAETRMASQTHYPLTFTAVYRRTLGLRIGYDGARFTGAAVDRMLHHLATLLASIERDVALRVGSPAPPRGRARAPDRHLERIRTVTRDRRHGARPLRAARRGDPGRDRVGRGQGPPHVPRARLARQPPRASPPASRGRAPMRSWAYASADRRGSMVAMIGILAAGGVYLPLDPDHPPLRLATLRDQAGAKVVVTDADHAGALAAEGVRVVRLDADAEAIAAEDAARPDAGATSRDLAYVLFTSGSTGTPKGVAVEHA